MHKCIYPNVSAETQCQIYTETYKKKYNESSKEDNVFCIMVVVVAGKTKIMQRLGKHPREKMRIKCVFPCKRLTKTKKVAFKRIIFPHSFI